MSCNGEIVLNADTAGAISETHCHHAALDHAKVEIARLTAAMVRVFGYNAARIEKGRLRFCKRHAVLYEVSCVLSRIPLKLQRQPLL